MALPSEYGNVKQAIVFGNLSKMFRTNNIIILKLDLDHTNVGEEYKTMLLDASQYSNDDIPKVVRKIQRWNLQCLKNTTSKEKKFSFRSYSQLPMLLRVALTGRWKLFSQKQTCLTRELSVKINNINVSNGKDNNCSEGLGEVSLIKICDWFIHFGDDSTSLPTSTTDSISTTIYNWIAWVNEATRDNQIAQTESNAILKISYSLRTYAKKLCKNLVNKNLKLDLINLDDILQVINNFTSLKQKLTTVKPPCSPSSTSYAEVKKMATDSRFAQFHSEISQFTTGGKCDEVVASLDALKRGVETYQKVPVPQAASESEMSVQF